MLEPVTCRCCGQTIHPRDNAGTEDLPLCLTCLEDRYTACSRCGALIPNHQACYLPSGDDEDEPYCPDCYLTIAGQKPIHDYYYRPSPCFWGDGPFYFGVELEIDEAGEDSDNARRLLAIANQGQPRLYCKHDGSLDDGFELVTHPMSLSYHRTEMPWEDLLREAVRMGYLSHQSGTCGLHIHVSREAFGDTYAHQEAAIARVLYFFEKHWEELLKFSRRTQRQLDRWAARYGYRDCPRDILDRAKSGHAGRYTCVNLQNTATVEFRIFRGTLKRNTLLASLELVDKICHLALYLSDEEMQGLAWTTFVSSLREQDCPELVQYLKERRLYTNAPVAAEVEV